MKNAIIEVAELLNSVMPDGNSKKAVIETLSAAGRFFAENENATKEDFLSELSKARELAEMSRIQRAKRRDNATSSAFEALKKLA